jgi:hypothetical protein
VKIVQIVPQLPPPYEGLGGNAQALAAALAGKMGIETVFVVGDPAWAGSRDARACPVPARRADALASVLSGRSGTVLLHYANYGYQRRGCPVWLVRGLLRWRGGAEGRRLVTSFHEVHASGPPWRSSFWLLPVQRGLAATVARHSDALVTSLPLYRELLGPWIQGREVTVMPVLSTVGEPAAAPPLADREPALAVFGGAGLRRRAYGPFRNALAEAVRALDAREVWDIGPDVDPPARLGSAAVRRLGVLPAAEVSARLLGAAAGFLAYPPAFLGKSGVFAAYCAHGVVPVCAWDDPPSDGLPCWTGAGDPQAVATAAREWYAGHALAVQAERFRSLLA